MPSNNSLTGYLYIVIGTFLLLANIGTYILFFMAFFSLYVFALGLKRLGRPRLMMKIKRVMHLVNGRE